MAPLWKQPSVILFFLIAFGVPWLGWTALEITGVERSSALGWVLFLSGTGCSLAGFVATYQAERGPGLKDLLRRCVRFRVPVVWWLYALFLPVAYYSVATIAYGLTHGGIGEVKPFELVRLFSPAALFWLITGPIGEEAGWRGFLLPRLLSRYSALVSSLILGVIWSVWHLPLYYSSFFSSIWGTMVFTLDLVCATVLMTVLFLHTTRSVLLAVVLHWSMNVSPAVVSGVFPSVQPESEMVILIWGLGVLVITSLAMVVALGPTLKRSA